MLKQVRLGVVAMQFPGSVCIEILGVILHVRMMRLRRGSGCVAPPMSV